jgi:hypothetical protein
MLLEIERNEAKRRELRIVLQQYIEQADRFLPQVFGKPDVDLTWVRIADATRRLGEGDFKRSKKEVTEMVDKLIDHCKTLEKRWVAQQRVFQIESLIKRAERLSGEINKATPDNWREIQIPFL